MASLKKPITLAALQKFVKKQDFKPRQKYRYFLKLMEETGELADAIRRNQRMKKNKAKHIKGTIEEELYDVLYYVAALANVYEIDLEDCAVMKETYNKK
jgi:NTP pyrophosphatase (non-canonical NTP hydrolase)